MKPGDGFVKTGGKSQLQRSIVDTERCGILTQAVVDETAAGKSGPVLMAVRLKVDSGKVSEIETVIARTGDFAFKPQGVLDTKDQDWTTPDARLATPHARLSQRPGGQVLRDV